MKFVVMIFAFLSISLHGCSSQPPRHSQKTNNAFSQGQQMANQALSGKVSATLPDGEVITGKRLNITNSKGVFEGAYYIGEAKGNRRDGKGAVFIPLNPGPSSLISKPKLSVIRIGQFKNGKATGLHKGFNMVNGIVLYHIFENGKEVKTYGELDVLLASGDFDAAYKKRGKKVYLGVHLKKDKNTNGIIIPKVSYNSPGEIAGLKTDDVILSINGISTKSDKLNHFMKKLIDLPFGKKARFKIFRQEREFDINFVPGIIPANYPGAESTRSLLWKSIKKKKSSRAYQKYLDTVTDKTYLAQAKAALKLIRSKEKTALRKHKAKGIAGLIAFCTQHPNSVLLEKELPGLYKKIERKKSFIKNYSRITSKCPAAKKYQPAYYELLNVGPEGMKVKDALLLTSTGTGPGLIATKIKYSNKEYKDFKFDELAQLKRFGLDDQIVSAMLESTYKKEQKTAEEYKKRAEQLAAENQRIKTQASRQQTVAASTSRKSEEKSMPLECIKLVAALKACDQTSGFLSMGCKAIARSSTDCPLSL